MPGYDYSSVGFYFLTICTQNALCLFGEIHEGEMKYNTASEMVQKWWFKLDQKFPELVLHEQTLMPNHVHGIIEINRDKYNEEPDENILTLGSVVKWFKTMSMNEYVRGVKQQGWQRFSKRLWQRNFYEHIIRDEEAYYEITEYIKTNPQNWGKDKYYQ